MPLSRGGHLGTATVLLDYGASLDTELPRTGETPIDIAQRKNNSKLLALLVDDYGRKGLRKARTLLETGDRNAMISILADVVNYYDGELAEQQDTVAKLQERLQDLTYVSPLNQMLQGMAMSSGNYGVYGQTVSNQMGINDARRQLPEDIKKEEQLRRIYKELKDKYAARLDCVKSGNDLAQCLSDAIQDAE